MTLDIKQAILHVLDTSLDTPVLSEACLELTADTTAFLTQHVEKAVASDDKKIGTFGAESPFLSWPLHELLPPPREKSRCACSSTCAYIRTFRRLTC